MTKPTKVEAEAAVERFAAFLAEHEPHAWEEVGGCVWCVPCQLRLYEGELPERKDPGRARRQADCAHDWDWDFAQGFYGICRACGAKEWGTWE